MVETTPGKVYKIVISVIDLGNLGVDDIKDLIENVRYPNHAINPHVVSIDSKEIEWMFFMPLNLFSQWRAEFKRLFPD